MRRTNHPLHCICVMMFLLFVAWPMLGFILGGPENGWFASVNQETRGPPQSDHTRLPTNKSMRKSLLGQSELRIGPKDPKRWFPVFFFGQRMMSICGGFLPSPQNGGPTAPKITQRDHFTSAVGIITRRTALNGEALRCPRRLGPAEGGLRLWSSYLG